MVVELPGQMTRTCSSRHLPVWPDMAADLLLTLRGLCFVGDG